MKFNNELKKVLLEAMCRGSLDTLIEIVDFIPVYGVPISKAISIILSMIDYYKSEQEEKNRRLAEKENNEQLMALETTQKHLKEKLEIINQKIRENTITQEKVMQIIRNEVLAYIKEQDMRISIYIDGIILWPREGVIIDDVISSYVQDLFEYNLELDEEDNELFGEIQEFINTYAIDYNTCYFMENSIIVNFDKSLEDYRWPHKRNDSDIIRFIHNLNCIIKELDEDYDYDYDRIIDSYSVF